jgi:hypothetical protein
MIDAAIQRLAEKRADKLRKLIKDQLEELGGDQTLDVIQLDRKVVQSGIIYGLGVLEGPYVRTEQKVGWVVSEDGQSYEPQTIDVRKPQYEFTSVWDFYPDMAGRIAARRGLFSPQGHGQIAAAQARRSA